MRPRTLAILAVLGGAFALLLAPHGDDGSGDDPDPLGDGKPRQRGVDRDPSKLLPSFRAALARVFADLRAQGFDPYLFEGYRTPERAAALAAAGQHRAIRNSLHVLGAAADVVDATHLWNGPPGFFPALAAAARKEGLTSGAGFGDPDHVQGVSVADEPELRVAADKNAFVASRLV